MSKLMLNGKVYSGCSTTADDVAYDNSNSGLSASNVQDVIDEVQGNLNANVNNNTVPFRFTYDSTSQKYGYLDGADTFCPFNDGSGGTDEVVQITNYTKNVSFNFSKCVILKVNHRILCHIYWENGSLSSGSWNTLVTLNTEDVTDVTEWSYGCDCFSGYYSNSGGASTAIARYNPSTRQIQLFLSSSTKTCCFLGMENTTLFNPEELTPSWDTTYIQQVYGKGYKLGNFAIFEYDAHMQNCGANWYRKVIKLDSKYTLSGGYWGGSLMVSLYGNRTPMNRDQGQNNSDGELDIYANCSTEHIWKIRYIMSITGLQT